MVLDTVQNECLAPIDLSYLEIGAHVRAFLPRSRYAVNPTAFRHASILSTRRNNSKASISIMLSSKSAEELVFVDDFDC